VTKNNETLALVAAALLGAATLAPHANAAPAATTAAEPARPPQSLPLRPCQSVSADAPITVTLGKSRVVGLPFPVVRLVVGGRPGGRAGPPIPAGQAAGAPGQQGTPSSAQGSDGVAETDITLLSPTELYVLGRRPGTMNVVLQASDGRCLVKDIVVTVDAAALQSVIVELLPQETEVRVRATEGALVLTGTVSDSMRMDEILSIASTYAGEQRKMINLLKVAAPQQVMLEVTIAEVSKAVLDHMNLDFTRMLTTADGRVSRIFSGIFGGNAAAFARFAQNVAGGTIGNAASAGTRGATAIAGSTLSSTSTGSTLLGVDAQQRDGIVRVLAEPNILAISGQAASFLSGGKIFIPVAQSSGRNGAPTITLEEKEFGVGLKFTPTVLDGGRVNLKLVSEVSELQQTGSPFTSINDVTAILPSMTTRRVDTTVQLFDGQSFMVAGLIKNNVTGAIDKFPGLGETPVVGALFRSTEFQNDRTELMFIVTPRLVKPMQGMAILPTDNHTAPTRADIMLNGIAEGARPLRPAAARAEAPVVTVTPVAPAAPLAPIGPLAPVAPVVTVTPVAPVTPLAPIGPLAPVAPVTSVTTATPETTATPVTPVAEPRPEPAPQEQPTSEATPSAEPRS